jgi:predicted AAA+ superfamily ATPase
VRVLEPWYANVGKRLVKSPKVYIRDSGLLHTLLGIGERSQLEGHPVVGGSWEGFVIEQLLAHLPKDNAYYWRTHAGAELVLMVYPGSTRYTLRSKVEVMSLSQCVAELA